MIRSRPPTAADSTFHITLPLSPDHRLLPLIQYNVVRGLIVNSIVLGWGRTSLEGRAGCSPPLPPLPTCLPTSIPPCLQPTTIQLSVPHRPQIDLSPSPRFRDNVILYGGPYMEELSADIYGGLFEGSNDLETQGVLVWGDPWLEDSWELTEAFVKKWRFMLKGCAHLIEATNRWREIRGEDRLVVEV
ncbi:hypothetical protein HD806DRAFT_512625 [Xylariaceae sp. AK1471]|nr:hypothetical protein HD806DRAFT_512625 [Xylariaceae sp. AK1471]